MQLIRRIQKGRFRVRDCYWAVMSIFERLRSTISFPFQLPGIHGVEREALNILIVCDFQAWRVGTVQDHLRAFASFSRNQVCFVDSKTCDKLQIDFDIFDCVVFHYSIVISSHVYLSETSVEKVRRYSGYKVLFIQDEYRHVDRTAAAIANLGVDLIYSAINEDVREQIYCQDSIRKIRRKTTLTGFVPKHLTELTVPEYAARKIDVGYRVRRLAASLGALGQEKWDLGEKFKRIASRYGLRCDIEFDENRRVYGKKWISFLTNCKAVLGSESSISFIDFDGSIAPMIDEYERLHPEEGAAEIQAKFIGARDGYFAI